MEHIDTNTGLTIMREMGSMDARITNIERDVGEIKTSLQRIVEVQAAQKGGRATLFSIGGGGVTVGGLIVAAAQWLGIGGHPQAPQYQPAPSVQVQPSVNLPAVQP